MTETRQAQEPSPLRMIGDRAAVQAVASELMAISVWLPNGHRVSDYGHDLMAALGNPDMAALRSADG